MVPPAARGLRPQGRGAAEGVRLPDFRAFLCARAAGSLALASFALALAGSSLVSGRGDRRGAAAEASTDPHLKLLKSAAARRWSTKRVAQRTQQIVGWAVERLTGRPAPTAATPAKGSRRASRDAHAAHHLAMPWRTLSHHVPMARMTFSAAVNVDAPFVPASRPASRRSRRSLDGGARGGTGGAAGRHDDRRRRERRNRHLNEGREARRPCWSASTPPPSRAFVCRRRRWRLDRRGDHERAMLVRW